LEFIYRQVRYPALARENGIEGTVVIVFVVEPDGTLTNIRIARDIGGGCGEEAQRIVELMNAMPERWTPGKVGGEAVRVQYNFPLKFKLEGGGKKKKRKKRE
jgi:periplasmic protein TonB